MGLSWPADRARWSRTRSAPEKMARLPISRPLRRLCREWAEKYVERPARGLQAPRRQRLSGIARTSRSSPRLRSRRNVEVFKADVPDRRRSIADASPSTGARRCHAALAEAEIEYGDGDVAFHLRRPSSSTRYPPALRRMPASTSRVPTCLIWTTTPWTLARRTPRCPSRRPIADYCHRPHGRTAPPCSSRCELLDQMSPKRSGWEDSELASSKPSGEPVSDEGRRASADTTYTTVRSSPRI